MNARTARLLLPLAAASAASLARAAFANDSDQGRAEALTKKMLEAIKVRSYDDFLAPCDDKMKEALTKQMLEGVSGQLAPKLKAGYKMSYFGKLHRKEHVTHLWKIEFAGVKDEALIQMSLKDGLVAGFFVQ